MPYHKIILTGRIFYDYFFFSHILNVAFGGTFLYIHCLLDAVTQVDISQVLLYAKYLTGNCRQLFFFPFFLFRPRLAVSALYPIPL